MVMLTWMSQQGPNHPKHSSWLHPIATCCLHYAVVGAVAIASHDVLVSCFDAASNESTTTNHLLRDTVPSELRNSTTLFNKTALGLLLYSLWLLCWRLVHHQPAAHRNTVLYEYCWLCNVTLNLSAVAAFYLHRPLIAGACCVVVGIDQLLWYVDLVVYALTGTFPVGVSKYIFWKGTSWKTRITCTHHLWTIPVLLYTAGGLHWMALPLSIPIMTANVCMSRWMTPSHIILVASDNNKKDDDSGNDNGNGTTVSATATTEPKYLNVNLSHELWKDIRIEQLMIHKDNPPVHVYLWRLLWRWTAFNTVIFTILYGACNWVFGEAVVGFRTD